MSSFRVKGPNTYRKEHPGKHVVVAMFVEPESTEVLFEMAVDSDFFLQIRNMCVEQMMKKKGEDPKL